MFLRSARGDTTSKALKLKKKTKIKKNQIYVFPEIKLHSLDLIFYIYVSVSNLYTVFPGLVCLFGCSKIGRLIRYMYVKIGRVYHRERI